MESNWRLNVAQIGVSNWGINLAEFNQRITLVGELITPLFQSGQWNRWIVQLTTNGQRYYYITTGYVPGYVPYFSLVWIGGNAFPAAYPVVADS